MAKLCSKSNRSSSSSKHLCSARTPMHSKRKTFAMCRVIEWPSLRLNRCFSSTRSSNNSRISSHNRRPSCNSSLINSTLSTHCLRRHSSSNSSSKQLSKLRPRPTRLRRPQCKCQSTCRCQQARRCSRYTTRCLCKSKCLLCSSTRATPCRCKCPCKPRGRCHLSPRQRPCRCKYLCRCNCSRSPLCRSKPPLQCTTRHRRFSTKITVDAMATMPSDLLPSDFKAAYLKCFSHYPFSIYIQS
jgi:hypothetical protein